MLPLLDLLPGIVGGFPLAGFSIVVVQQAPGKAAAVLLSFLACTGIHRLCSTRLFARHGCFGEGIFLTERALPGSMTEMTHAGMTDGITGHLFRVRARIVFGRCGFLGFDTGFDSRYIASTGHGGLRGGTSWRAILRRYCILLIDLFVSRDACVSLVCTSTNTCVGEVVHAGHEISLGVCRQQPLVWNEQLCLHLQLGSALEP